MGTDTNWTAYFDNGIGLRERFGPCLVIAAGLGTRFMLLDMMPCVPTTQPDGSRSLFGANRIAIYEGAGKDGWARDRIIDSTFENGVWTYSETGEPMVFESALPEIVEIPQLSTSRISAYCAQMGIDLFNPHFYREGVSVEQRDSGRSFTFERAQEKIGIAS